MSGVAAEGTEARAEGSDVGPGGDEGEDVDPGGEERVPGIKVVPEVYQPTKEELEEHNATHAQYRAWCPHCVRGRGQANHHQVGDKVHRGLPEV